MQWFPRSCVQTLLLQTESHCPKSVCYCAVMLTVCVGGLRETLLLQTESHCPKSVCYCAVMLTVCVGGLRDDTMTNKEGLPTGGQEAVDYEVPEKIKTLHHLALQYVNQVGTTPYNNVLRSIQFSWPKNFVDHLSFVFRG